MRKRKRADIVAVFLKDFFLGNESLIWNQFNQIYSTEKHSLCSLVFLNVAVSTKEVVLFFFFYHQNTSTTGTDSFVKYNIVLQAVSNTCKKGDLHVMHWLEKNM